MKIATAHTKRHMAASSAVHALEKLGFALLLIDLNAGQPRTVDPATAAALAEAAISHLEKNKQASWQADIGSKLDGLLSKADQIISMLINLGVRINKIPEDTIVLFVSSNIRSLAGLISMNGAGYNSETLPESNRTRIDSYLFPPSALLHNVELLSGPEYGYSPIDAVVGGMLCCLYGFTILGTEEGKKFATKWKDGYLANAIDPSQPGSIAEEKARIIAEAASLLHQFDSYMNQWWRIAEFDGTGPGRPGEGDAVSGFVCFRAEGTIEAGARIVETKYAYTLEDPHFPPRVHDRFSSREEAKWRGSVQSDFDSLSSNYRATVLRITKLQDLTARLTKVQSELAAYAST